MFNVTFHIVDLHSFNHALLNLVRRFNASGILEYSVRVRFSMV